MRVSHAGGLSDIIYAIPVLVWMHVYDQSTTPMVVPRAQMFPYLLLACCVNYGLSMNIENRIGQTAGVSHDRHRSVPQADELRQSTRFEKARHNDHISAGINQV